VAVNKIEPANERIAAVEQFCLKNVPLITHMQISDAFQEFLCIPDQIKLIDYDNKRLGQIKSALFTADEVSPLEALEHS
jgi:hypothetical protein